MEGGDRGLGEKRVVDVERQPDQRRRPVVTSVSSIAANSAASAVGIEECAALDVERRHAFFRDQQAHRARRSVELLGDPAADRVAFGRRGPHQRDVRVVLVEQPSRYFSGTVGGAQKLIMSRAPSEPT